MITNVIYRVTEVLSCHDGKLVSHFKENYSGPDNAESVTEFYCNVIQEFPQPNVALTNYLKDRTDCEFRWFRCFSDEVIPLLKQNITA